MIAYDTLRLACGLSQREAAEFHGVRLDTVKSWTSGRTTANARVMDDLRDLHSLIDTGATRALDVLSAAPETTTVEVGYPADDHEARVLGLPCVGAWRAMIGRVIAASDRPITLVPRGSTTATALAAGAAGR